jgi:DNA-directed RNA polymerase specialized sigma24 family protein
MTPRWSRESRAADSGAFTAIYDRYLPLVLRWSLRETTNRELAADLAAETFAVIEEVTGP